MNERGTVAVVLAAGMSTRMKSARPKVLHAIAGRPVISYVTAALGELLLQRTIVVVGRGHEAVAEAVAPAEVVVQDPPLGTGHAVMAAREALAGFRGDVLILMGDVPLIDAATLEALLAARRAEPGPAVVVLSFRPRDAGQCGRLVAAADGSLRAIVEFRDATPEQRAIGLCNGGAMAVDGALLFELLDQVGTDNTKGEYYLTDIVAVAARRGLGLAVVEGGAREAVGINSRENLAAVEAMVQARLRRAAMEAGATLIDPDTIYLCHDTVIGGDSTVGPYVFFGPGVTVGEGVTVKAFSHLEGARVADGAIVGPFARLRPGAEIEAHAHIGNFVEVKQAVIEAGAKVNHLSYIGDARVGARANVGAGTITCNYDGFEKAFTDIGAGAFIGSNTALVAPVKVGAGAIVGAGSVIARDVARDALALTRAEHTEIDGGAAKFRRRKGAGKAAEQKAGGAKKARGGR